MAVALMFESAAIVACSSGGTSTPPSAVSVAPSSSSDPDAPDVVGIEGLDATGAPLALSVTRKAIAPFGPSLIGGPVEITPSSGAAPAGPVEVSFTLGATPADSVPQVVHFDDELGSWLLEPTQFDRQSSVATAVVDTLSPFDVIDRVTWFGGYITGNRTSGGPSGCVAAPGYVEGVSLYNGRNDALRACFGSSTDSAVALQLVNNRGYPFTIAFSDAAPRNVTVEPSIPGDVVGGIAEALARRDPDLTVIPAGGAATVTWDRPAAGQVSYARATANKDTLTWWVSTFGAALKVVIGTKTDATTATGRAYERLRSQLAKANEVGDCPLAVAASTSAAQPQPNQGIAATAACETTMVEFLRNEGAGPKTIDAFRKAVKSLAVLDAGYKLIDALGDEYPPPRAAFDLRGEPKRSEATVLPADVCAWTGRPRSGIGIAGQALESTLEEGGAGFSVILEQKYSGDLDGVGALDTVVQIRCSGGGSGATSELYGYASDGHLLGSILYGSSNPSRPAFASGGDREGIHELQIADGVVTVMYAAHATDDGVCCPSLQMTDRLAWDGQTFVLVARDVKAPVAEADGTPEHPLDAVTTTCDSSTDGKWGDSGGTPVLCVAGAGWVPPESQP